MGDGGGREVPKPDQTYPTNVPPPVFTVPGVPFIPRAMTMGAGPGAGVYARAQDSKASVGDVTVNVYESANPRETAKAVAGMLRQVSPRFAAYST